MNTTKRAACLLIHGFGGSPFEMEPLIPALEALGCTVDLPTLPGHYGNFDDFCKTRYPDWLNHARERLLALVQSHETVIVIGFSMGAGIALSLAAQYAALPAIKGVIALAPPWRVYRLSILRASTISVLLKRYIPYFKKIAARLVPDSQSRSIAPFKGYEGVLLLPQLHSLALGMAAMRRQLPDICCPLFLMTDARDRVCPPSGAFKIARAASSASPLFRLLHMRENITSHHMLTTHQETRDVASAHVSDFVRTILSG